jgi:alpha-tubulin suppressor-like RCC1 family protein
MEVATVRTAIRRRSPRQSDGVRRRRGVRQLLTLSVVVLLASVAALQGLTPARALQTTPAWAWGNNTNGQLGNNGTTQSNIPVQVVVTAVFPSVAGGVSHSLAVDSAGHVWAWGYNAYGQLGNNSTTQSAVPVEAAIPGTATIMRVAGGGYHSLALDSAGHVWAWGYNAYGQLGNNTTTDSHVPVQVSFGSGVTITAIAAGRYHSLALDSAGHVWAWGYNAYGQLGDDTVVTRHTPVLVETGGFATPLTGVTSIAAGWYHSLALDSAGHVWAWGYNAYGQLGNNSTGQSSLAVQVTLPSGASVTHIAPGGYHSLALDSTGRLWSWGYNAYGQLGTNDVANRLVPTLAVGAPVGTAIAGGGYHSLLLDGAGHVWTAGDNHYGQLGNGSTQSQSTTFVGVANLTNVTTIAAGGSHSLALQAQTTVTVGTVAVSPQPATVPVGKHLSYSVSWTVPSGGWRSLDTLDVLLRDSQGTAVWVQFHEAAGNSSTLALIDPKNDQAGPSFAFGSPNRLETDAATVYLTTSSLEGVAGAPTVTLHLDLSFKPQAVGRTLDVLVRARNDAGDVEGFIDAGTLTVQPG